jgi:hypothetical protein
MSRAVNDLADIIAAIPTGTGEAAAPGAVEVTLSRANPRVNTNVEAFVHVTDAAGQPIDAVGVRFIWRLASGRVVYDYYTSPSGDAARWQNIGDAANGQVMSVDVVVTVNGQATTTTKEFTASKR